MSVAEKAGWPNTVATARAKFTFALIVAGALLCIFLAVPSAYALLTGVAVALLLGNPVPELTGKSAQWLLKTAVIGLGAGINLSVIVAVGVRSFWLTAISIFLSLAAGMWLAKSLRLRDELGILISAGTAICGGSAIAAVSGVIKPKAEDMAVSLSIVFLLNALALLIFPPLGAMLGFDQHQFGTWAALAIHDTSSVVGAALAYGKEAAEVATTTKLVRALWIAPMVMMVAFWWSRKTETQNRHFRFPIPLFILGFFLVAVIFTYFEALAPWRSDITALAKRLFSATLFLIGVGFSRSAVKRVGVRPVLLAVILWVAVMVSTAAVLMAGWVR